MGSKKVQYYFAYGSNLLSNRIAVSIPNPQCKCKAVLKNYEFVYSGPVTIRWHGSAANIKYKEGSVVCGAVYTVSDEDLMRLDIQEGVPQGHYKRLEIKVMSLIDFSILKCIAYVKAKPEVIGMPSPAYKNVIINGAKEIDLPEEYISFLRSFEDNGYDGPIEVDLPEELYLSS